MSRGTPIGKDGAGVPLRGSPGTELIPYPFAQSLLPRHTTSGTLRKTQAPRRQA